MKNILLDSLGWTLAIFGVIIFVGGLRSGQGWLFGIIMIIVGFLCIRAVWRRRR